MYIFLLVLAYTAWVSSCRLAFNQIRMLLLAARTVVPELCWKTCLGIFAPVLAYILYIRSFWDNSNCRVSISIKVMLQDIILCNIKICVCMCIYIHIYVCIWVLMCFQTRHFYNLIFIETDKYLCSPFYKILGCH